LTPVSISIPDGNTAPCWIVITRDGVAFTSNTDSNTISAYSINAHGDLTLADGVSAQTGMIPTDLALGPNDRTLYVLNLKSRTVGAYAIGAGGALTSLRGARGLPKSALGLAALPSDE
jgi:6-phosphogluconolactonase (cycloisomerase 2 family)